MTAANCRSDTAFASQDLREASSFSVFFLLEQAEQPCVAQHQCSISTINELVMEQRSFYPIEEKRDLMMDVESTSTLAAFCAINSNSSDKQC
mmetsp:Transcript_8588/g.17846  ORF Transcript_8588/g.17846 Transcript_8588/m.17846 type:complete len:92 (-) Transcript_8588:28-303(-)